MTRLLFPLLVLALAADPAFAQPAPDPKKVEAAARATAKQLWAHLPPPVAPGWNDFALRVKEAVGGDEHGTDAGWEEWADGTATPYIIVTRTTLAALASHGDALALLLAREHARLALGLTRPKGKGGPAAADADADLFAVKLLLRAGYSVRQGLAGTSKLPRESRPAWLARVAKLLDPPSRSGAPDPPENRAPPRLAPCFVPAAGLGSFVKTQICLTGAEHRRTSPWPAPPAS